MYYIIFLIFRAWVCLLDFLYFVGYTYVYSSFSLTKIFPFLELLSFCFLYCFYFHFQFLKNFSHFLQMFGILWLSWISLRDQFISSSLYFIYLLLNFFKWFICCLFMDIYHPYKVSFMDHFCVSAVLKYTANPQDSNTALLYWDIIALYSKTALLLKSWTCYCFRWYYTGF